MTLEELSRIDSEVLTCKQIAPILGMNEHNIRICAHDRPDLLGFPVIIAGSRVRIPKRPFIHFLEGKEF